MTLADLFIVALCLSTCLRLLFYSRNGASFKRGISIVAYLAIVATGSLGIAVLIGKITFDEIPALLVLGLSTFTLLVFIARGNVSQILRITRGNV